MFELSTVLTVSINIAGGSFSFLRFIFPETITLCSGCKKSLYAAIFELNAIASVLPVKSSIVTNLINLDGSFFVGICFIPVISPQMVTTLSFGSSGSSVILCVIRNGSFSRIVESGWLVT